ncbi:hypothetical protein PAND9192_01704 [Photobacterium andalusiense]|uniref:Uncharacterized protein n=1 Tax=Photobacterium andalusiense TaxID=2204296 RepID=A0A1Y6MES1_9GAMM|nr:hypothetical protein PAND9192_01704 [Photobacterium andalusiense]
MGFKKRTVIDPTSFTYATDASGDKIYKTIGLFSAGGGVGLMNFMFEGLVSGSNFRLWLNSTHHAITGTFR